MRYLETIAVTGVGMTSSLGRTPAVVARKLLGGNSGVRKFSFQKGGPEFTAARISFPVKNVAMDRWPISRATALGLAAAQSVLAANGAAPEPDPRLGVIHATTYGNLQSLLDYQSDLRKFGLNRGSPMQFPNTILHAAASFLSVTLGATAFNITLSNESLSGMDALETARQLLSLGAADRILVVTSEDISPELIPLLQGNDELDWQFPDPFGEKRSGYAPGEAGVAVLLETVAHAQQAGRTIYSVFQGSSGLSYGPQTSASCDQIMRCALEDAGVSPEAVGCVVASANGSRQDREEANAIHSVFGKSLPVTSVKAALGECAASGFLLSLAATISCGQRGYYPFTVGRSKYDSKLPPINLLRHKTKMTNPMFMVNAFNRNGGCSEIWTVGGGQT